MTEPTAMPDQSLLWTASPANESSAPSVSRPEVSRASENSITFPGAMTFGLHYRAARAFIASSRLGWAAYALFVGAPLAVLATMLVKHADVMKPLILGLPGWLALLLGPVASLLFSPLLCLVSIGRFRLQNPAAFGQRRFTLGLEGLESRGENFLSPGAGCFLCACALR